VNNFPWEALATAATGGAAVIAAVIVGLKQSRIAENQSRIEENKLKFDLFDRRMRIFEIHSKLISSTFSEQQRQPFIGEFMDKRGEVRFLFDDTIVALFEQAYEISIELDFARSSGELSEFQAAKATASQNSKQFLDAVSPYMKLGNRL
jgi:hypothetical protein